MRSLIRSFLAILIVAAPLARSGAAESSSFLHQGDMVALVGGEDLVAAADDGSVEAALLQANPGLGLRFRSLAWEGDTVYAQPRDLNYPLLEDQMQRVGATVALVQFGAMESMSGREHLAEFVAAYEKLIDRLSANGTRRVALITPGTFEQTPGLPLDRGEANRTLAEYRQAIVALASRLHLPCVDLAAALDHAPEAFRSTRDGVHLNPAGRRALGQAICAALSPNVSTTETKTELVQLVREKNRLWFNYYRPQNWAFLAGDRVSQPSSHDHIDPTKRWFPAEMELFLPLIEAKETAIAAALK